MKERIKEVIQSEQIKVASANSGKYARVQMNYTGFAYLGIKEIEDLQTHIESVKKRLWPTHKNNNPKTSKQVATGVLAGQLSLFENMN